MTQPVAASSASSPTAHSQVRYRPIRPDDVSRLQDFHRGLSMQAIRLRFHGYLRELPDTMARRFCEVDRIDRVAIVAVTGEPEIIVGVGRFDRIEDGLAEMAFVVSDAYQHRGIGSELLRLLMAEARTHGIATLLARVVPGNSSMRQLLVRTGLPIREQRGQDEVLLWLSLGAESRGK